MTNNQAEDVSERRTVLVDARGLSCPLPLLEARRALQLLRPGAVLVVLATDPAAPGDFADFALARDLELDEVRQDDGSFRLTLRPPPTRTPDPDGKP